MQQVGPIGAMVFCETTWKTSLLRLFVTNPPKQGWHIRHQQARLFHGAQPSSERLSQRVRRRWYLPCSHCRPFPPLHCALRLLTLQDLQHGVPPGIPRKSLFFWKWSTMLLKRLPSMERFSRSRHCIYTLRTNEVVVQPVQPTLADSLCVWLAFLATD